MVEQLQLRQQQRMRGRCYLFMLSMMKAYLLASKINEAAPAAL